MQNTNGATYNKRKGRSRVHYDVHGAVEPRVRTLPVDISVTNTIDASSNGSHYTRGHLDTPDIVVVPVSLG